MIFVILLSGMKFNKYEHTMAPFVNVKVNRKSFSQNWLQNGKSYILVAVCFKTRHD